MTFVVEITEIVVLYYTWMKTLCSIQNGCCTNESATRYSKNQGIREDRRQKVGDNRQNTWKHQARNTEENEIWQPVFLQRIPATTTELDESLSKKELSYP